MQIAAPERATADEALAFRRLVERERIEVERERLAAQEEARPAILEAVKETTAQVATTSDLPECIEALTKAAYDVIGCANALHLSRQEDDANRRVAERAREKAIANGVDEKDLPALPPQTPRMPTIDFGFRQVGEGGGGLRTAWGADDGVAPNAAATREDFGASVGG